jgi:hypothetical protein
VANSLTVPQHRDTAALSNVAHKLLRATRNNQIDLILEREHFLDVGARVEQVDGGGRNISEAG